jgi:hypothetical protein
MAHLLHIDSSARGDQSVTRRLTTRAAERCRATHPGGTVTYRDFAVDPIPHFANATVTARMVQADQHTPAQHKSFARNVALVDEITNADTVLLGLPSSTTLVPDRRGPGRCGAFVISAAAPLTAVGGVAPPRLALTGLTGVSHAYLAVAVVVALFSVDDVATARHITNAAAPYASIARGMSRPAGVEASCVGLSAYTLFECASYCGFGAIARLACNSFRRFSDVATTAR